jgi:hypothetical protein
MLCGQHFSGAAQAIVQDCGAAIDALANCRRRRLCPLPPIASRIAGTASRLKKSRFGLQSSRGD